MAEQRSDRYAAALAAIDAIHDGDPTRIDVAGQPRAHESVHAEAVTMWIERLDPDATELQLLAGRASHLRRWESPRDEYPLGRAGYLRWRTAAAKRHASDVAAVLQGEGYREDEIDEVQRLVRKEGRTTVPAAQVHEDALCLAFLTVDVDDFAAKHGAERSEVVLAKTVRKMSSQAVERAGELPLSAAVAELLAKVLQSQGSRPTDEGI